MECLGCRPVRPLAPCLRSSEQHAAQPADDGGGESIDARVGSIIPTKGATIPVAVRMDLGCGMMAVQTSLIARDLPDNLNGIRSAIETGVPHGRTNHGG